MGLRIVTPENYDEWRPFDQLVAASFGQRWEEPKPEELARVEQEAPYETCIGVADGDQRLGACGAYEFELTLPGGATAPVAGLTAVGGDVTKSGRGALRAMIEEHLRRSKDRGSAASLLNASESSLYSQFGYGHATSVVGLEIDPDRARFRTPFEDPGSIELVGDISQAVEVLRAAYDACARVVAGTGSRSELWWQRICGPKETWRGGGSQIAVVHRDAVGDPDGYLLYAIEEKGGWVNDDVLTIRELLGASVATELALFRFAVGVPLQRNIRWPLAPVDVPAGHHLFDPRQLHVVDAHDLLWLRPLDVPALLSGRAYDVDDTFVLGIEDDLFEDQRGPWRVRIVDGVAHVERVDGPADLALTPSQLGMIILGDHRVRELWRAGVVDGAADVVRRVDRAFLTDRRPYNLSKF